MYKHEHQKDMTTPATAQMLSTVLYYKRFFPYYVSNVLAGLDENGKGCIYSYDPIGHCERSNYRAGGSAGALLQPLLDNQVQKKKFVASFSYLAIKYSKSIICGHFQTKTLTPKCEKKSARFLERFS